MLQITKYLYEKLRLSFHVNNAFLPGVLRKSLFSILAKDNIDKNAKSTFAKSYYHGTINSILQFSTTSDKGAYLPSIPNQETLSKSNRHAPLPKMYSSVKSTPYKSDQAVLFALEYFLKKIYPPGTSKLSESLAKGRLIKFGCNPDNDLRKIPMSRPGLIQHVKRSCYQAVGICGMKPKY